MSLNDIGKPEKPIDPRSDTSFLRESLARLTGAPKILVVEDNENDLELAMRLLAKFNCTATPCNDPHKALGLLESEHYDLVLMDLVMPRLSGMAVLQKVKPLLPETRFILCSGHTDNPMVTETIRHGGSAFWE